MTAAAYSPKALTMFEEAFGAPWRQSRSNPRLGIATALQVLEVDLRREGAWESPRLPAPALAADLETPWLWTRPLDDDELRRRWVVSFDKDAAYLGVLGGLELGIGNPQRDDWHRDDGFLPWVAFGDRPGYWRVTCEFLPPDPSWPDPLNRPRDGASWWVTTPTLELAIGADLEVKVLESWTWPMHRRLLRRFGQRCQNARKSLQEVASAADQCGHPCREYFERQSCLCTRGELAVTAREALSALKGTYGPTLGGFFARVVDRERDPHPPWYRPDWRHHIIAKARANLWRSMARWRAYGAWPIAVFNDAVYFASDELGPEFAQRFGIELHQGKYHVGAHRLLDQVLEGGRLNFLRMWRRG